jgi:uncharacterized protein involved in tolerance to divalent cations
MIWNPHSDNYLENPYPHLKACREHNPIQKGYADLILFFKYNDVNFLLKSSDFQTSELSNYLKSKEPYIFKNTNVCPHLSEATKLWPMYLNGEKHKQIKAIFSKSLYDINYNEMIINALDKTLQKYNNIPRFNLVEFCSYFIFLIIKQIFGLENYESLEKFEIYSNMLAKSQDLFIPKQTYQEINSWYVWGKKIYSNSKFKENIKTNMHQNQFDFDDSDLDSILSVASMAAFETSKDNLSMAFLEKY